jgi:hypothetical protein
VTWRAGAPVGAARSATRRPVPATSAIPARRGGRMRSATGAPPRRACRFSVDSSVPMSCATARSTMCSPWRSLRRGTGTTPGRLSGPTAGARFPRWSPRACVSDWIPRWTSRRWGSRGRRASSPKPRRSTASWSGTRLRVPSRWSRRIRPRQGPIPTRSSSTACPPTRSSSVFRGLTSRPCRATWTRRALRR